MFGGAFIRRGLCTEGHLRFQIGYAYNGREICVLKSTGLAYSWKLIYVSNLQRCFTEIRLEDVDLSKLSHAKLCLYGRGGRPPSMEETCGRLLFLGHRSLIKNITQTAVMNIVSFHIVINLTFRKLFNIHFQK